MIKQNIGMLERTWVYCHILFQISEVINIRSIQNDFYQTIKPFIFPYSKCDFVCPFYFVQSK